MNQENSKAQTFFNESGESSNLLWEYVQSLTPETISQLSKPHSREVLQVMERNIMGMLGTLPSEQFGIKIETSRENLGKLLVSAMMSGYFLRNAEQRMDIEKAWNAGDNFVNKNAE